MAAKISEELSLEAAFMNASRGRAACRWPASAGNNRLEPAYRPLLQPRFTLAPGSKIFTIGSCFARNIEAQLGHLGFDVPMLTLSVLPAEYTPAPSIVDKFTPPSALQEIDRTLRMMQQPEQIDEIIAELLLPTGDGGVIDLELRDYVPVTRERAHERRRHIFDVFCHAFDADCVVVTLGLVECWFDRETGRAIQETPHALAMRRAKDRFLLKILDIAEVVADLDRTIRLLMDNGRPGKKILITVSPIPLEATFSGSDVVVANCYSKSTLRTAAQMIFDRFDSVDYFPSYEMVTMSRGEGVWESDLVHVSDAFVAKIVDVLVEAYLRPVSGAAIEAQRSREILSLAPEFRREGPFGWTVRLPAQLAALTDTDDAPHRSPLLLFEAGRELGPGHEVHATLCQLGGGCYSCWKDTLYFSTSDGSDPNTNNRAYTVRRID